jgi:hypothetical protein
MSDEPKKPNGKRSRWLSAQWAWAFTLLLVLYVLSPGPLAFLGGAGLISGETGEAVSAIYAPLHPVWRLAPRLSRLMLAYEDFCDELGERCKSIPR